MKIDTCPAIVSRSLVGFLASVLLGGCIATVGPADDYSQYLFVRDDLTPAAAQLLMQEYTQSACEVFDRGIGRIADAQADSVLAENILLFRESGLVAIRRAGWRLHPVGAAFDSAILVEQMEAFLETDLAKEAFGPARPGLVEVVAEVRELANEVMENVATEPERTDEELISAWVRQHPLDDLELTRVSPLLGMSDRVEGPTDPITTISRVQFSAAAAYARLNDALLALPADVRRQIEGVVRGIMREPILVNALVGFARLGDGMKEAAAAIAALDRRLDKQRDVILDDVDRQRAETIEVIRSEREVVLAAIASERTEVLGAIASERQALTDAVAAERQAIVTSVEAQVGRILDSTDGLGERVVDRAADRLDGLVLVASIAVGSGLFLGLAAIGVLLRTRPVRA